MNRFRCRYLKGAVKPVKNGGRFMVAMGSHCCGTCLCTRSRQRTKIPPAAPPPISSHLAFMPVPVPPPGRAAAPQAVDSIRGLLARPSCTEADCGRMVTSVLHRRLFAKPTCVIFTSFFSAATRTVPVSIGHFELRALVRDGVDSNAIHVHSHHGGSAHGYASVLQAKRRPLEFHHRFRAN